MPNKNACIKIVGNIGKLFRSVLYTKPLNKSSSAIGVIIPIINIVSGKPLIVKILIILLKFSKILEKKVDEFKIPKKPMLIHNIDTPKKTVSNKVFLLVFISEISTVIFLP